MRKAGVEPANGVKNGAAHLAGKIGDCDEIVSNANDFAKIQKVNKIVIDTRCGSK